MKNIVDIAHTTLFNYGTVGKETFLTDSKGNILYVGDIVELDTRKYSSTGGDVYKSVIVEDEDGPFVMGWKCYQDFNNERYCSSVRPLIKSALPLARVADLRISIPFSWS